MKYVTTIVRVLLGSFLALPAIAGLLQLMPAPEMTGPGGEFFSALVASGYLIPTMQVFMLIIGALLIINRFVPLALIMLVPLTLNWVLFHVFLDMATIGGSLLVLVLHGYLTWQYWDSFKPVLQAK